MWMWMLGCTTAPPEVVLDEVRCAPYCVQSKMMSAPTPSSGLTAFETELLDPVLKDLRAGVRPFTEGGVGICTGSGKLCERALGLSPGELPPGDYHISADLAVPNIGPKNTWKVKFHLECTRTVSLANGDTRSSTQNQDREYTVVYAGKERGYHLAPLWKITSPGRGGTEDCRYKLTMPHPDGDKVISGSWLLPAP